jgi:uncharacterized protein (DUF1800 family)
MRILTKRSALVLTKIALFATLLSSCGVDQVSTSGNVEHPTLVQSSRILSQASFGPSKEEISRLQTLGTSTWLNDQFAKPQSLHLEYVSKNLPNLGANQPAENLFLESFWQQAITGDDQLRQRVTYALSQILVISFQNDTVATFPRGVASYYDTLAAHAFGNYRDLLESVTLHPMMGIYLSSMRNQKASIGREPDENYAREVMQLFTIGLRNLNMNGTDTTSPPTPTYTNADIKFLAKVFTGWSWAGSNKSDSRFNSAPSDTNLAYVDPNRELMPMQNYGVAYHDFDKIADPDNPPVLFADVAGSLANTSGEASLKIALDKLFNHPNVGPFIGRQLIQRLVTSNPSPAYIGRVAAAFEASNTHPRGDMKALIAAVLLDPEAMDPTNQPTYVAATNGKLREPVLRLANWMRAFHVKSSSGRFMIPNLDDPQLSLGQTPMNSPTVFNFFKPEYQAPGSQITAAGKFAPEMQTTEEISVFGYLNYMQVVIPNGAGISRDVKADYTTELALAALPEPDQLVDYVKLLLTQNQMSDTLRTQIITAIKSNQTNSAKNKVYLAIYLTMASPEYLVQK